MATETLRCSDCNAPLRSVPAWLTTAKVKFTCNSCPKRPARASAPRFDTPIETRALPVTDDPDMEVAEVPDLDDDLDTDIALEDADDVKDE